MHYCITNSINVNTFSCDMIPVHIIFAVSKLHCNPKHVAPIAVMSFPLRNPFFLSSAKECGSGRLREFVMHLLDHTSGL